MKKKMVSLMSHLLVFIAIEILFVLAVLHEFPEIGLFEKIGIVHTSYWVLLIIAGILRENFQKYRQKFLATYIPVVYHIAGHIYVGMATIESMEENSHQDHSILWMIIASIVLGIFIFIGERLIHRKYHCDTCHAEAHKHCHEE